MLFASNPGTAVTGGVQGYGAAGGLTDSTGQGIVHRVNRGPCWSQLQDGRISCYGPIKQVGARDARNQTNLHHVSDVSRLARRGIAMCSYKLCKGNERGRLPGSSTTTLPDRISIPASLAWAQQLKLSYLSRSSNNGAR